MRYAVTLAQYQRRKRLRRTDTRITVVVPRWHTEVAETALDVTYIVAQL